MQLPVIDIGAVLPEVIIALTGLLVLVVDLFGSSRRKASLSVISCAGLFLAFAATSALMGGGRNETAFSGAVAVDPYGQYFKFIFLLSAFFTILISPRYLKIYNISRAEYLELILFCTLGMMVMVSANDLVTIYIGLELMAISIYLMAGFQKDNPRSSESSMKYFLLGSFASAILLYGMSFLYGITRTTNLTDIARYLDFTQGPNASAMTMLLQNPRMLTLGLILMTVGFAFKIAAVPFHMWTPDVYEGAPTPLTAFMSVGPKVAGFAVIMRVYMISLESLVSDWWPLFWLLATLTIIVGNVVAVAQKNIKRMLAYSSIAHAGYLLIGVVAAGQASLLPTGGSLSGSPVAESMTSVMVYLFSYMFMNMGAFAIVISLGRGDDPCESLEDYAGLAKRRPLTAALMTALMLSLAGIPGTFGFIGKFYIFKSAIYVGQYQLAIIGVLASVVAAFYYIRIVVYMYMREPEGEIAPEVKPAGSTMYAAVATTFFTILFGIFPGSIVGMAKEAVEQLLGLTSL